MRADTSEVLSPTVSPWLAALRDQLSHAGAGAPPETLGPATALKEVSHICGAMLAGREGPKQPDRASLVTDLAATLEALGPATTSAGGPVLLDFRRDLNRLSGRLESAQGARAVSLALDQVLARLRHPVVVQAAWDDTVEMYRDTQAHAERGETRIRILREICELRDHDWQSLARRLSRVLSDDASAIADLDAEVLPAESTLEDFAGLDEPARIGLCRDLLTREPERGNAAVWLLFQRAFIHNHWLKIGPIQFFDARLMPDGIRRGGNLEALPPYEPPAELEDWDEARLFLGDVEIKEEHAVFARVWLPDAVMAKAGKQARELLETVLEVANEESRWILQEGEAVSREGGGWRGSMFFSDPRVMEDVRRSVATVWEGTGRALNVHDAGFVERLAKGDEQAAEAVEDARWVIAVARSPTIAQRIALGTRALERTLNIAQASKERWPDVAKRYLLPPWLHLELHRWIEDAIYNIRTGTKRGDANFARVEDLVAPSSAEPGTRRFSARGSSLLEEQVAPLDELVPEGSVAHRSAREALAVLSDPRAAAAWLHEGQDRFRRLLARTQRARNAIVHGQRPSTGTLETVDNFVRDLGRLVAQESWGTASTGDPPLTRLEHWRTDLLLKEARLSAGDHPLDFLLDEPEGD